MATAALSTKELAHKAREDKANSLRGLFDKCFVPLDDTHTENATCSENTTYSENDTCSENDTLGNTTCSENKSLENATCPGNTTPENATCSENKTLENTTCSENATHENATYGGRVVQLSRSLNFTALGVLAVLLDEFSCGTGILNISQMSKACGVARSTVIAQLRTLEDKGIIALGAPEKGGRLLKIMCSENATCPENATLARGSSSSSFLKDSLTTTTTETTCIENTTCSENAICPENTTLEPPFDNGPTYTAMKPWEKSKLKGDAEELFYVALITKSDVGLFSMQTLRLFKHIYDDKGRDHALALFLFLLPKAKDNPTGYIWSSYKQGAEPNADSFRKAKEMREFLDCLARNQTPEDAKEQMQTALDKNDTQALLSLAEQQEKYKKALHLLSWGGTFEGLIQKREEIVTSLLNNGRSTVTGQEGKS